MEKHRDRMRLLLSNKVVPFKAQLIVIACDRTPEGLDARMEGLRAALGKTGCEPLQPAVSTSTLSFFNCATPGLGPWVNYRDFWHKMDDAVNVGNLWPVGSTPRANLMVADWITDGDVNNLIGGKTFVGAQPVATLCTASTGGGKSTLLQSLALQTAPQFKFIVVIDDGLSWQTTCQKLDPNCVPIVVRANGKQTFNIFDTCGQPLTAQHLSSATALCHLLVGRHADSDKDKLRAAILAEAISEVYGVAYRRWRNANPEAHFQLCMRAAGELGIEEFEALSKLDSDPETEHLIRDIGFAHWTPGMFPTLFDLQDELHAASLEKGPHAELCATLASLLRPWLRDGRYGPIVDGPSNVDLGSVNLTQDHPLKIIHFELGAMGASEAELKAVAGFLITNQVRNHIEGMPRGIRKQLLIEEMTAFLKIPGGEQIAIDFYERFRKFSCQVISVFQQYSLLLEANPKVAKALIGNSQALLLLRNTNRRDLDTLSSFVRLPEVIKDRLASMPLPESMKGRDDAYAGFVLVNLEGQEPRFTVGRNVISQDVERITTSSGDVFEAKEELKSKLR
jgi:hypothetical protein